MAANNGITNLSNLLLLLFKNWLQRTNLATSFLISNNGRNLGITNLANLKPFKTCCKIQVKIVHSCKGD
ncbi:predicted protein [Arabidopsis lyrata subsp. lyrata]|uniref:Predicted protein n=1 Tax=Arabidopsis lyrata subsp. lyrata TaxID=81972 RepID=D7KAN8_ARALL|nr:predicted protein [Arabidopsis lyrata subsp. lyrata]